MTLYEAILARHSVRAYQLKSIPQDAADALKNEIDAINAATGLHIQLVLDEPQAFQSPMAKYGKFRNCTNYIVMAGSPASDFDCKIGYYGEQLVLLAQTLGLNTCWVGLTYKKVPGAFELAAGEKLPCVIALGYGETPGVQHNSKAITEISNLNDSAPEWFRAGVEAAQLAPTAVNQQKFRFELQPDGKTVKALPGRSLAGYTGIDLGIAMCHFDVAVRTLAPDAEYEWERA